MKKKMLNALVSRKIGWEINQSKEAIERYAKSKSILNANKVLSICVESENPQDRIDLFTKHVLNFIKRNKNDYENVFVNLLLIDPAINALCLFNIMDKQRQGYMFKFVNLDERYEEFKYGVSYERLTYKYRPEYFCPFKYIPAPYIKLDHEFFDPYSSACHILDNIASNICRDAMGKSKSYNKFSYRQEFMFKKLIKKIGLPLLNVKFFRDHATALWHAGNRESYFRDLFGLLNEELLSPARATKRKYWLTYMLVSIFVARGLKVDDASKKVQELIGEGWTTNRRRYFQMKKVAKKNNYSMDDIIRDYQLESTLEKLITVLD